MEVKNGLGGNVACMTDTRGVCIVSVVKPEEWRRIVSSDDNIKLIFKKRRGFKRDWSGTGYGHVERFCEHRNELPVSTQ